MALCSCKSLPLWSNLVMPTAAALSVSDMRPTLKVKSPIVSGYSSKHLTKEKDIGSQTPQITGHGSCADSPFGLGNRQQAGLDLVSCTVQHTPLFTSFHDCAFCRGTGGEEVPTIPRQPRVLLDWHRMDSKGTISQCHTELQERRQGSTFISSSDLCTCV